MKYTQNVHTNCSLHKEQTKIMTQAHGTIGTREFPVIQTVMDHGD